MSEHVVLTAGAIESLVSDAGINEGNPIVVQVVTIEEGVNSKGGKKYTIAVSDGIHFF
jgi:hypothetical protein